MSDYFTDTGYIVKCVQCNADYEVCELSAEAIGPQFCYECERGFFPEKHEQSLRDCDSHYGARRIGDFLPALMEDIQRRRREFWHKFTRDGYVYLLGGGGFYKIGRSINVSKRLRQLEIQLPWSVHLLHTIPCEDYRQSERKLHQIFAEQRANGEWFELTLEDVAWIRSITKMKGDLIDEGECG